MWIIYALVAVIELGLLIGTAVYLANLASAVGRNKWLWGILGGIGFMVLGTVTGLIFIRALPYWPAIIASRTLTILILVVFGRSQLKASK